MRIDDLGRAGRFGELRELLQSGCYTEDAVCARFGLKRQESFELNRKRRPVSAEPDGPSQLLATLFLAGDAVSAASVRRLLPAGSLELLQEMGVLSAGPEHCHATVSLYPIGNLYIASDRWDHSDDSPFQAPDDTVYPAFIPNTRLFMRHMPIGRCDRLLELCSGTGAAALRAARDGAREAWAGDIAERSTRFAAFNCQLNGIENVHPVTSDLYAGFDDQREPAFDRIVAHPPYVPTLAPKWIFFSGGEDGEAITRRAVEGLPANLKDGGVFLALTMGSDRGEGPFEWRIREWLGESGREFDVALVVRKLIDPLEFALRSNAKSMRDPNETEAWKSLFARLSVESLVYGFVIIQRRNGSETHFTCRREADLSVERAPWEWLLACETAISGGNSSSLILESHLHASKSAEFEVLHGLGDEGWTPRRYTLRMNRPFIAQCDAAPWMAHLMSLCDGRAAGRDHFRTLQANGALPHGVTETEFARAAAGLVSGGFVEIEGLRPPRAAE